MIVEVISVIRAMHLLRLSRWVLSLFELGRGNARGPLVCFSGKLARGFLFISI